MKVLIASVDAEYHTPKQEKIILHNKKGEELSAKTIIDYKYVLFGIYLPQHDTYKYYYKSHLDHVLNYLLNFAVEHQYTHITVYSFYLYAELQFLVEHLLKAVKRRKCKIEIVEENKKNKLLAYDNNNNVVLVIHSLSNSLFVEYVDESSISIRFIDIAKLTNATNLEELVSTFLVEDEEYKGLKKKRDTIADWTEDDIIRYNKLDCIYQYRALKAFEDKMMQMCDELILHNSKLTSKLIKIIDYNTYSFGQVLVRLIRHRDVRQLLRYESIVSDNEKLIKYMQKHRIQDDIEVVKQKYSKCKLLYRGGGMIMNFCDILPKQIRDAYMVDFVSLYPISLIIALSYVPETMANLQFLSNSSNDADMNEFMILKLEKLMKVDDKYFFAYVEYEHNKDVVLGKRYSKYNEHDEEITKQTYYVKRGVEWFSKHELSMFEQLGVSIKSVKEIIYWDISQYSTLQNDIKTLLLKRIEYKKKKDNMSYLLKIALNSLYGKFAQYVTVTSITNKLIASMITAISRYIMLKMYYLLKKQNVEIYHTATDSVICNSFRDEYITELTEEIKRHINVDTVISVEVEPPNTTYIFSLKHYAIVQNDKVVKYAHLGLHLQRNSVYGFAHKLIENFDGVSKSMSLLRQGIREGKKDDRCIVMSQWQRESFFRVNDVLHLAQTVDVHDFDNALMLLAKACVEEYTYITRHDTKKMYNDNKYFTDIFEAMQYEHLYCQRVYRLKESIKKNKRLHVRVRNISMC